MAAMNETLTNDESVKKRVEIQIQITKGIVIYISMIIKNIL